MPSVVGLLEQRELGARRRVDELREEADRVQAELALAEREWKEWAIACSRVGEVLAPVDESGQDPARAEGAAPAAEEQSWRARGKLDVPKERFISYGQTNAATPELYGWAGWDHREQAQALTTYFTNTALSTEEITPFLAGLLELQPWLSQWHDDFDVLYSGSPADFFVGYRQQKQGEHGLTDDDLRAWRPAAATRGRRPAKRHVGHVGHYVGYGIGHDKDECVSGR
jgi:hypothetical protein